MLSTQHAVPYALPPVGLVSEPAESKTGLDLPLFIPRYKVRRVVVEMKGCLCVYLRRKYIKLPLFLKSFYLACYTKLLSAGVNPESRFNRVKYDPDAYMRSHGVLTKHAETSVFQKKYLSTSVRTDVYHGYPVTSYFVTARFSDRSTPPLDQGVTIRASSKNVILYIQKEMLQRIGDPAKFDFARFFEDFLAGINYQKAVLVMSAKYNAIHRLHALQSEIIGMKNRGEFE